MDEDFILIINNFLRLAAIELEGQLVRVYGQFRSEWCLAEVCELMTAVTHHRCKEVHLYSSGVIPVHPVLSKVYLHRLPGSGLGELLQRTERFFVRLCDVILLPDSHHKVEYRFTVHVWEVWMALSQMIMNLAA